MTSLTFQPRRALARQFKPGDEIIVTELDHHGNVDTWLSLAQDFGSRSAYCDECGKRPPGTAEITRAPNERTRLIAVGAASNAIELSTPPPPFAVSHASRSAQLRRCWHLPRHNLIDVKS